MSSFFSSSSSSSSSSFLVQKSENEDSDFTCYGPKHLQNANWCGNEKNQYSVLACLVSGVYVLERDRQQERTGKYALAPPWWRSFGFELAEKLTDPKDGAIFGAIYKYTGSLAPSKVVIAFRGTVTQRDWKTNFRLCTDDHDEIKCFEVAMKAVERIASNNSVRVSDIWLCGHSLGAAIALLCGKHMAKSGVYLKTFLFNPPFILRELGKFLVGTAAFILGALAPHLAIALLYAASKHEASENDQLSSAESHQAFSNLCRWRPCLLVNPRDFICKEYIKYYEKREKKREKKKPIQAQLTNEEMHLPYVIPSTKMIRNSGTPRWKHFKEYHGIKQWWEDDLQLNTQEYLTLT